MLFDTRLQKVVEKASSKEEFVSIIKSLELSNRKIRSIANGVPAIIAYVDKKLKVQFHNRKYSEWFGIGSRNIIGSYVKDVIGEDDFARAEPYFMAALNGETQDYSRKQKLANGEVRYVNAIYKPHINKLGVVQGFYALVVDISEKVKAEEKLKQRTDQQLAVAQLSQQALSGIGFPELCFMALELVKATIKNQCCEIARFDIEKNNIEIVGKSGWQEDRMFLQYSDLIAESGFSDRSYFPDNSSSRNNIDERSREKNIFISQGVKNGLIFKLIEHDRPYGFLGVHFDNKEPLPEEDISFLQVVANTLSASLESEATEKLLHEAKEEAEKSSKAKSAYLANMSHEIRTPMNGVIGMIELLKESDMNASQLEYLEVAHRSAETLLSLINNILDMSKIETGKLELENVQFNLAQKIRGTVDLFAERAKQKGLYVKCAVSDDLPVMVEGDPTRLSQVVTNLIGNALKFTSEGGITVSLIRKGIEGGIAEILCEVTDTGIGISDEAKEKVFEAFSQADKSTTRNYGGTGLGLSISKQIVQLMDGDISVKDAEKGTGTTFYFTFKQRVTKSSASDGGSAADVKRLNILMVGDDLYQGPAVGWIKNWGANIYLASTGLEAMSIIEEQREQEPISVLILSEELPGMDFKQFVGLLQKDERNNSIRMIAVSEKKSYEERLGISVLTKLEEDSLFAALANAPQIKRYTNDTVAFSGSGEDTKKILIVEDNPVNQKVTSDTLKKLGYETVVANHGEEALEILEEERFDMILMDCQMPILDGYETTAKIRHKENSSGEHILIVATTAHAMRGDKEKCLEVGMDDYLAKPIRMGMLKEKLDFYFGNNE